MTKEERAEKWFSNIPDAELIDMESKMEISGKIAKKMMIILFSVVALELILLWVLSSGEILTKTADILNSLAEGNHTRNHYRGLALFGALVCLAVFTLPFILAFLYKNNCLQSEVAKVLINRKNDDTKTSLNLEEYKNMEKIFFEYNENSMTLYDALKKAEPPSDIMEIFRKLQKQIYSYADFEIKHFEKMQTFAEHKQLVNFLCDLLKRVCPHYEKKEFYYILVILSYSEEQMAIEYLGCLTKFSIANQINLCHVLLTIFNEINSPQWMSNKVLLEQYFEELYRQSDYFEFIKRLGLDTSKMEFKKTGGEGSFSFDLSNMKGIQYAFELDKEIDKRKFCKLSISVYAPKGLKACFDLSLTSEQFLLYHHHKDYCVSSKEEIKLLNKETKQAFYIENCTDLLELKSIVGQIESILQTSFDSNIVYSHFTKPLKGKKELQKWWEDKQ